MSRMVPQGLVDALRQHMDVSIYNYGIEVELYVADNLDDIEDLDVYAVPADQTYTKYDTSIVIAWSPDKKLLRKLGLFTEGEAPMVCWIPHKLDGDFVDVPIRSYFKVPIQYVPDKMDTDEFELVEVIAPGVHDAVATRYFKFAPRRVRNAPAV